jgi:hypothetical protein
MGCTQSSAAGGKVSPADEEPVNKRHFDVERVIGQGGFGKVRLLGRRPVRFGPSTGLNARGAGLRQLRRPLAPRFLRRAHSPHALYLMRVTPWSRPQVNAVVKNAGTFSRAAASAGAAFCIHELSRLSYRQGLGGAPRCRMRPDRLRRLRHHARIACRVGAGAVQRAGAPEIGHRHMRHTNGRTRRAPIGKTLPALVVALQPLTRQRRHRRRR